LVVCEGREEEGEEEEGGEEEDGEGGKMHRRTGKCEWMKRRHCACV
jgi:hypothetical protein